MRVLMTVDTVGGVWTYSLGLIRALPHHHFVLATLGPRPTPAQRAAARELSNLSLRESDWKLEWMEGGQGDIAASGEWLIQLEAETRPDVVHLNGFAHGVLPFRAPVVVVAHSCVCSWWRAVKGAEAPEDWSPYRRAVAEGLRGAAMVVAPTGAFLREMSRIYGDMGPTRIIHNGIAAPTRSPAMPVKAPFVCAAGRLWDEAKNMGLLHEVAPGLAWPIKVAGAAAFGEEHFGGDALQLLGLLEPVAMYQTMEQATIWAHPALYEPFGLAVLEAAQRGCVLVLSDIPTLRELWEGAALFVEPRATAAWRGQLEILIDSPASREIWAQRARSRAACYSMERNAHEYAALYRELA